MSASEKTALVPLPLHRSNARRVLLAALMALLAAAAIYKGFGSRLASAAPQPASPSVGMTPTEQSLPAYPASADADVGPADVEPVLVGSP